MSERFPQTGDPNGNVEPDVPEITEPETFLVRTTGGPYDGALLMAVGPWPLPQMLGSEHDRSGCYVKQNESDLPPQPPDSGIIRGAEYLWVSGN